MNRSPLLSFRGQLDPSGYHLADSEYGQVIVPNGGRRVWCQPLTGEEFRIFASTAGSPEGALDFVRRYGPVTLPGSLPAIGDRVETVTESARAMRRLLNAMVDPRLMSDELGDELTPASLGIVEVAFFWNPTRKAPVWSFRPVSLGDTLWLQFGQAMMRGAQLRACVHCGGWFEVGAGTGRRADAKFCSDEHRVAFNSLKRSKGD
jgi:hypothetical protein